MNPEFRRGYLSVNSPKPIQKSSKKLFFSKPVDTNLNCEATNFLETNSHYEQIREPNKTTIPYDDVLSNKDVDQVVYLNCENNKIKSSSILDNLDAKENDENVSEKEKISSILFKMYIKHKMTKTCINDFISIFRQLYPDVKIPYNIDKIIEFLSNEAKEIKYDSYDYCVNCDQSFVSNKSYDKICQMCNKELSKYYHINILSQLKRILSKNPSLKPLENSEIYQTIKDKEEGKFLTFTLNTDGISPFKSSKISIWPLYLVINELNINERYKFSNMILAGLWYGKQKPCFFNFMNPIIRELKSLELGEIINLNSELQVVNFYLIFSVLDKPARSALLNMKQFNGFFGCLKCYQKGESLCSNKNGSFRVSPYKGPLRSHKTYYKDLVNSISTNNPVRGVKGTCILDSLKYYFPIESTMIDYMHTILEGVVKKLLEYWFNSTHSDQNYSLRNYKNQINEILKSIRVPKFIPRPPRDLDDLKFWKANELLSFLISYSLPILRGFMELNQYMHLINLVVAVENLLKKHVNKEDLNNILTLLREFVRDMSKFYGLKSLLSGVHELLHIVDDVRNIGNLNEFNCFPFENFNRESLNLVNGKNLIAIELINSFTTLKVLNEKTLFKTDKIFSEMTINDKKSLSVRFSKNLFVQISKSEADKIKNIDLSPNFFFSSFIKYKNVFLSSLNYKVTKRMDYCVKYNNLYGLIKYFVHDNDNFYGVCSILSFFHCPFYNRKFPELVSSTKICGLTESIFVAPIEKMQKCVCIVANGVYYVSQMDTSHLFC